MMRMFKRTYVKIKKFFRRLKKDYLVNFVSVKTNEIYFNYIIIFYYHYKF